MTIAQVFEYEKVESSKSVPPPMVPRSRKKDSINTVKNFGCQNDILLLKICSSFRVLCFSQKFFGAVWLQ